MKLYYGSPVRELICDSLVCGGFDGLYCESPQPCCCDVYDLAPDDRVDCAIIDCMPGNYMECVGEGCEMCKRFPADQHIERRR